MSQTKSKYTEYHKNYYLKNKDKIRNNQHLYNEINKDRILKYNKDKYNNNAEYRERKKELMKINYYRKKAEKEAQKKAEKE